MLFPASYHGHHSHVASSSYWCSLPGPYRFFAICADVWQCSGHLSSVILTKADSALTVETVAPEAVELDIAFRQFGVGD
jgi:hypothetical protein